MGELLRIVVAADLAEDLGHLAVLPLEGVAGALALQADEVLRAGHDSFYFAGLARGAPAGRRPAVTGLARRQRWRAATRAPGHSRWTAWPQPGSTSSRAPGIAAA